MRTGAQGAAVESTGTTAPMLEAIDLEKRFGGVHALAGASLTVEEGETMALVGDNGAGKSTLVKAISGVQPPDSGTIKLRGKPVTIGNPRDAGDLGIEVVYQDLALANSMNVPRNLFLGDEIVKWRMGWFSVPDDRRMTEEAEAVLERLRIRIPDPYRPVGTLSGGQRQAVAIGRAIRKQRISLLVLDEPTAALGVEEVKKVLGLIGELRQQRQTMMVISHDLEHVFQVSDRIAVMRSGRIQGVVRTAEVSKTDIVRLIVGDIAQEAA